MTNIFDHSFQNIKVLYYTRYLKLIVVEGSMSAYNPRIVVQCLKNQRLDDSFCKMTLMTIL